MTATSRSGGNRQLGIDGTPNDGGPIKPKDLPPEIAKKFDQLMRELPLHMLRKADVHELKLLSELLHLGDQLAEQIRLDPLDHKTARVYMGLVDRVHRLSSSFGLTPMDRQRMQIQADEEDPMKPFHDWLADAKGENS